MLYNCNNVILKLKQKLQPTVTVFVYFFDYVAKIAAKPIPSISAAAISIAV